MDGQKGKYYKVDINVINVYEADLMVKLVL